MAPGGSRKSVVDFGERHPAGVKERKNCSVGGGTYGGVAGVYWEL